MRILEEIGTDVMHEPARKLLAEAGQKVEDERVYWDRGLRDGAGREGAVLVPAPGTQPRALAHRGRAEGVPVWMNVGGPPFASDLDEGRRSGRMRTTTRS